MSAKPAEFTHTHALVLRRTNYGEADRIIDLLTPLGKIPVIAKSVRKPKSKLAGNIEPFCLIDVIVRHSHSQLAVLTSAKLIQYYANIVTDITRLELASEFSKQISRLAESATSSEHFDLLNQIFAGLNRNYSIELTRLWAILNLGRLSGEEFNFYTDTTGAKLQPDYTYRWDFTERALRPDLNGDITADHIKLARLLTSSPLNIAPRVHDFAQFLPPLITLTQPQM